MLQYEMLRTMLFNIDLRYFCYCIVTFITCFQILQLYQISLIHHGLMMVGPSGSGKSMAWRVLLKALERLESVEGIAHVIDPKVSIFEENTPKQKRTIYNTPMLVGRRSCLNNLLSSLTQQLVKQVVNVYNVYNMYNNVCIN